MNSFVENVNYVAGLDNLYGSEIELYKNNLSLKNVQHDIELKFSYYNNYDKKIHSIVHSEPGVLVGGIEDTLLSFKTLVESSITGSEFTCTVSHSVQDFIINNISMVNISIFSNNDEYKTYELEMKVVTAGSVTYDVFGEVKNSLKILPSLAMITSSEVDIMANVYEIKEEIVTVSESIANVITVSDSIANVNTVAISIDNVNIVGEDIDNVNTVASNIVELNSIVSNMTEILLADDNAAIATAKALESSDSAAASLQSALDSAASAALFPDHIADTTNPHEVTKSQVGLEFAENTSDADKIVASAGKLTAARDISLSGEVSGTVTFDGSANVDMAVSIAGLDASKLVSGVIDAARLPSYVDDVIEYADLVSFPVVGETSKIYIALDTNKAYRWSGSVYIYITSGAVDSVNGQTGIVEIVDITGNAGTVTNGVYTGDIGSTVQAYNADTVIDANYIAYTQAEKDKVANIPDNTDLVLGTTTLTRFDKILGSMDIIDMEYLNGDLVTVRYTGDNDTDVFYRDVLEYTAGDLTTVKHYYNTANLVTESGLTTLVYDINKNLISSSYTEV